MRNAGSKAIAVALMVLMAISVFKIWAFQRSMEISC